MSIYKPYKCSQIWGTVMCVVYRVNCWEGQCIWISIQLLAVCIGLYICGTMSHPKKEFKNISYIPSGFYYAPPEKV